MTASRIILAKPPVASHAYHGDGIHDEDGLDRCTRCGLPGRNRVHTVVAP